MIITWDPLASCNRIIWGLRGAGGLVVFSLLYRYDTRTAASSPTNSRGRHALLTSVLHELGRMAGHWRGEQWMWEGGRKGGVRVMGFCDEAQRNMAGYDVWRLKKTDKIP